MSAQSIIKLNVPRSNIYFALKILGVDPHLAACTKTTIFLEHLSEFLTKHAEHPRFFQDTPAKYLRKLSVEDLEPGNIENSAGIQHSKCSE